MPPSCRSSCDLSPSLPRPTPSRPLVHWIVIVANHQSGRLAVAETDDSEGERGSGRGVSQSEPLRPLSLFADNEQVSGKKPSPPPSFLPSSLFLYPFLLSCHSSVNKRGGLENQLARTRATYGKQARQGGGREERDHADKQATRLRRAGGRPGGGSGGENECQSCQ